MAPTPVSVAAPASAGGPQPPAIFGTICAACHSYAGSGGNVGPALDGVGDRYSTADLRQWLADPQAIKPGTAMPNLNLSDTQLDELTTFLMASRQGSGR